MYALQPCTTNFHALGSVVMLDVAMDMNYVEPCHGTREFFPCNRVLTRSITHDNVKLQLEYNISFEMRTDNYH